MQKPIVVIHLFQQELAKMAELSYFGFLVFLEIILFYQPPHLLENYAYAKVRRDPFPGPGSGTGL